MSIKGHGFNEVVNVLSGIVNDLRCFPNVKYRCFANFRRVPLQTQPELGEELFTNTGARKAVRVFAMKVNHSKTLTRRC